MKQDALTPLDTQDIESDIRRMEALLDCSIFQLRNHANPLFQSAFIEAVILVRDLLAKLKKADASLLWTDSVLANDYVSNITDLVTTIRDAACHSDSFKRHLDKNQSRAAFCVIVGKSTGMVLGGLQMACEYEDDVAFYYGKNRLYLRRGLIRAYKESCIAFAPLFTGKWEQEWIQGVIQKRTLKSYFSMDVLQPPNQPVQPTPGSVTPRATEGTSK